MSAKGKRRKAGKSRRRCNDRKGGAARINCAGLKIEVPPELDLPAGAPFATTPQPDPPPTIPDDVEKLLKPLSAVATNAWRAKTKMTDPATGEPLEEMRRVYRFVEGVFAALGDAGVRVLDSTGKIYDSGMALKVLSFDRVPGLGREEVIETIRPSVIWHERLLQMGEVIVGIPDKPEQAAATGERKAANGEQETVAEEPVSAECSATSDGRGDGIMPPTNRSPDLSAGQKATPSARPVDLAEAEETDDATGKRRLDAHVSSTLNVTDASGRDNSANPACESASDQLEGVDNGQDND